MENFNQFYKLLDSIFSKKSLDIVPDDSNFNLYLMNRYCSFKHPMLCRLINDTTNVVGFVQDPENDEECYNVLRAIMPKLPWTKIEYVSKPSTKNQNMLGYTDEEMDYLAETYQLGKREIRDLLMGVEHH